MEQWVVEIAEAMGLAGIFVLMVLENVFPPMPSEAIMGAAGLAIERGALQFWPVLAVATAGTVLGNWFWYWLGNRWGYERLGPFVERWGRWLTLEWEDIERASRFFRKHGHWVVFFTRFLPVMRTMISLPAGLAHMPLGRFLLFTAAGAMVWNVILILGVSMFLRWFPGGEAAIGWIVVAILALSALGYLWRLASWRPRAER